MWLRLATFLAFLDNLLVVLSYPLGKENVAMKHVPTSLCLVVFLWTLFEVCLCFSAVESEKQ